MALLQMPRSQGLDNRPVFPYLAHLKSSTVSIGIYYTDPFNLDRLLQIALPITDKVTIDKLFDALTDGSEVPVKELSMSSILCYQVFFDQEKKVKSVGYIYLVGNVILFADGSSDGGVVNINRNFSNGMRILRSRRYVELIYSYLEKEAPDFLRKKEELIAKPAGKTLYDILFDTKLPSPPKQ
jgi:hypothetical protein